MKTFCRKFVQIQFFCTLYVYFKSRWEGGEWWGYISQYSHYWEKQFLLLVRTLFPWLSGLKLLFRIASVLLVWTFLFFFFNSDIMGKYCMEDIQQKFSCREGEEHINTNGGRQKSQNVKLSCKDLIRSYLCLPHQSHLPHFTEGI